MKAGGKPILKMEVMFLRKVVLHGVVYQNIIHFITTAVRISDA
jgi:hypothetical protein